VAEGRFDVKRTPDQCAPQLGDDLPMRSCGEGDTNGAFTRPAERTEVRAGCFPIARGVISRRFYSSKPMSKVAPAVPSSLRR